MAFFLKLASYTYQQTNLKHVVVLDERTVFVV